MKQIEATIKDIQTKLNVTDHKGEVHECSRLIYEAWGQTSSKNIFANNPIIGKLKEFKAGDPVIFTLKKNAKGFNDIVGIAKTAPSKGNKTVVDYNTRAAIGQAFNLAMNIAIRDKREEDKEYIQSQFTRIYQLAQEAQKEWI